MVSRITGIEQVWFEPLQSHALEVGLGEGNFRPIQSEGLWPVGVDQLTLDQEGPEFFGVSPIERVWILDFCPRGQRLVVATGRAGKATDGDSKVVEDSHVWIELTISVDPVLIIFIVIIIPGIISGVISGTISGIVVAIRVRVSIVATQDGVAQVGRDTASRVRGWRWGIMLILGVCAPLITLCDAFLVITSAVSFQG